MQKLFFTLLFIFPYFIVSQNPYIKNKIKTKHYFYKDKVVSKVKWYSEDNKIDSLKTFYRNGSLNESFYYSQKGRLNGTCTQLDKTGEESVSWIFENGILINRIDHKYIFNQKNVDQVVKFHEDLDALNQRTNYNPKSLIDRLRRATLRNRLGNTTLALQDYLQIDKYNTKYSKNLPKKMLSHIYDELGGIYSMYEQENQSLHYRVKAIKFSPKETRLLYNLGSYLYVLKNYRLSMVYLKKVKEVWPTHAFSNWVLASMYSDLEEYNKAMEYVNVALERENNIYKHSTGKSERDRRTIRGLLYHKLGDSESGIADLNEALKINELNSFALRNLGVVYHDLGQFDKACVLLQKADSLGYEKIHDRFDLKPFLNSACNRKPMEEITKFTELPYIYPNPTVGVINVNNYSYPDFEYELYDFQSKLIKKGKANKYTIDLTSLNTGVYILKIINTQSPQTFRVIKN